jgi:pSer/pThr/pTyr-binding forkhead associated (FHA) protein
MRPGSRKQIIIVKDAKIPAIVGRTINSDFKIGLNSVSRRHASIEFKQGSFYVRDLDSKYGTLVRIKDPIRIEGKLKVQVGDVLIRFDLVMKKFGKEFVWKYN